MNFGVTIPVWIFLVLWLGTGDPMWGWAWAGSIIGLFAALGAIAYFDRREDRKR
jgi:membrane associated rhomboid family serine protease